MAFATFFGIKMILSNDPAVISPAESSDIHKIVMSENSHSLTTEKNVTYAATTPLNNAGALAETHASTEAEHASVGLPQLDTAQWPGQILWLVIIFTLFYLFISRLFVPRLSKVILTRKKTLHDALAEARAMRDEAEAQAKAAEADLSRAQAEARSMASEAMNKTNQILSEREAAGEAAIMAKLDEAEIAISAARTKAMQHVDSIAKDITAVLIKKLTGKPASETALTDAYKSLI